ncbi:hypothetical protein [Agromyces sp. CF514]|uniref:hypothetical protein n=1 Tax=Agromyces sp. CF514 TaxID=1881031 RepID=UPI0015A62FB1|nr:hypothetical protein [Agromyces sp. CF514]
MTSIPRARARTWLLRYLPSEVLGTVAALAGAWATHEATGSLALAALVGSLAETVGYYTPVVVRAVRGHAGSGRVRAIRAAHGRGRATLAIAWLALRSIAVEFGPAELVDSLLVRPALLWMAGALWGPNPGAWLVGKLVADAVFYAIAIVSFESGRRIILPAPARPAPSRTASARTATPSGPLARPLIPGASR